MRGVEGSGSNAVAAVKSPRAIGSLGKCVDARQGRRVVLAGERGASGLVLH
jgi:hypothetical protein